LFYDSKLIQKIKSPFSSWSFLIFLFYGVVLLWFLLATVHDRNEEELIKRMDPRFSDFIQVWINHGYLKHGGMGFRVPVNQKPDQRVWRSTTLFHLQLGHVLERMYIAYNGKFSYTLLAIHNQIITMLSSCLLGFLAMRLTFKVGVPFKQAVILGLSSQTVYQTFPFNLNYFWGTTPHVSVPIFLLLFLILEEGTFCLKDSVKKIITKGMLIILFVINSPAEAFLFLFCYYFVKIITCCDALDLWKNILVNIYSFFVGIGLIVFQLYWVKSSYPEIEFFGSTILPITGFDGSLIYYYDHMDLLGNRYLLNLPGWHVLLCSGILAIIAVISIIQRENKPLNQQTVLLSLICLYIPYAFLLSRYTVIHIYLFDNYLAIPIILALFAFLPAWLEIKIFRLKYMFVILSGALAFGAAGLQILAYWLQIPPFWFV
jgi:hypothetical protein